MLTPSLITSGPLPGRRHSSDPFSMSSHHHTSNGHHESNLYGFSVVREENHCRWRLPLWLLLFSGMVSVLTLSFLLTGTVYPNSWTRFSSESMGMFSPAEGFYRPGHQPSTFDGAASNMLEPVSHAAPDFFARISRSGDITMAPRSIGRPSSCGPATLVDNSVSLLVQVRMPHDTPRGARCAVTSGITLARRLEAAGKAARVQMWSLAQATPDANTWRDSRPQREAHVSSFDVRPGEVRLHSAEFGCPPPAQSVQTFEVACAGGDDDACAVDVWQDLFRVEIRAEGI
ncbi:hypothetical protein EDB84DRAFT_1515548 [Lactarius hengduanensis]|nr:hypothetical protein EDB84DRAFT_1515548 [Lactarius hengduanensis]